MELYILSVSNDSTAGARGNRTGALFVDFVLGFAQRNRQQPVSGREGSTVARNEHTRDTFFSSLIICIWREISPDDAAV